MATAVQSKVDALPILRGGKWVELQATRFGDVFNPSTGTVLLRGGDGRSRRGSGRGVAGLERDTGG